MRCFFFKKAVKPDNMLVPINSREDSDLFHELCLPVFVILLLNFRKRLNRLIRGPVCKSSWQVFLDGNTFSGLIILGDIGNTEAAMSENTTDCVPTVKNRAWFKRQRIYYRCISSVIAAKGTGSARRLFSETIIACIGQSLSILYEYHKVVTLISPSIPGYMSRQKS